MSAGHTPGPWAYNTGPSLHGRYHTVVGANDDMVCECYEGAEAEQEANARLIAAAPEMLDALERCQNFIANTESEFGETFECGDLARAVIAKARGDA